MGYRPGGESYAVLLEALLEVRQLRSDRGGGLDKHYLGNLVDGAVWNDRKLDNDALPNAVSRLIKVARMAPVAGPEIEQAAGDEGKRDGITANHPLAMLSDLAVTRGD
jgi:hypothetical protein